MDLRSDRGRAFAVGSDAVLLLVLVLLSLWLGERVIGAVYVNNPKVHYVAPEADRLVVFAWVATAVQVAAVALWRRWPQVTWSIAASMLIVHIVTVHRLVALSPHPVRFAPLVPSDAVLLIALYGLAAAGRFPTAAIAGGLTTGLGVYSAATGPADLAVLTSVLVVALTAAVFAAGLASRTRSGYLVAMTQRATDLELARVREAELAALAERSRLARDIHDTVAHALSIIVVQAQGGAAAQQQRPEETAKALDAIIDTGRQALAEMRGLLSIERTSDHGTEFLAPRGTADVPNLAKQYREAGREVDLVVHGLPAVLPLQLDHTIYRIVQESLTNAAKHASADAAVLVDIRRSGDIVQIKVCSTGTTDALPSEGNPGRGLQGMRERVHLLGGHLRAGPDTSGGFVVTASLPLGRTK